MLFRMNTCGRSKSDRPQYARSSYAFGSTSVSDDVLSSDFEYVYAIPKCRPAANRRSMLTCRPLYVDDPEFSANPSTPNPMNGRSAFTFAPGFACTVPGRSWLILRLRWLCSPRRPTYPTSTVVPKPTSR